MQKLHISYLASLALLFSPKVFSDTSSANKSTYRYGAKKTATSNLSVTSEKPDHYFDPLYNDGCSFRFSLKHREANGIGYDCGYTSLDGFLLFKSTNNWFPFFDVRGHIFNTGRVAGNIGFGLRYLPMELPVVFGINAFYDLKSTNHSTFQQAGFGAEALMEKWEVRANGYFPVFSKNNLYAIGFNRFEGNNALFRASRELSFKGYDLSLSRHLFQRKFFSISSTLGGYMFFADYGKEAKGGLLKFTAKITPSFTVEVQGSYDSLFKGIAQVQAALNIPFGKQVKVKTKGISSKTSTFLARRIAQEVDRFEMIVSTGRNNEVVGNDPRTNEPLHIVFVNNTRTSGDGSFESPYALLSSAESNSSPGDMVYVYTGNGTSTKMNSGITLQEKQWLQGESNAFILSTAYGSCGVPATSSTVPSIANSSGYAVVLDSENIITGFNISGTTGAIVGAGTQDFTSKNNTLVSGSGYDVSLPSASGDVLIEGTSFTSSSGLAIASSSNLNLTINSSAFTNDTENMSVAIQGSGASTFICKDSTFTDAVNGSSVTIANNSVVTTSITNNTFSSAATSDLYNLSVLTTANGELALLLDTNTFSSTQPAVSLTTDLQGTASWFVLSNIDTYSGTTDPIYPFSFETKSTSTATLYLIENTAGATGFTLTNSSALGLFQVASPTSNLPGVEALNTGDFTTSGTITYISYDEDDLP